MFEPILDGGPVPHIDNREPVCRHFRAPRPREQPISGRLRHHRLRRHHVDEVNEVARELWCPLCSGVRLDACELKACDQMKDEIAIKLTDGEDLASIKSYFVDQYGPQVLGEPPREGFNLLAWILPIAVLLAGGVFLVTRGRKLFRRPDAPVAAAASGEAQGSVEDPYADQLEKELKQYD